MRKLRAFEASRSWRSVCKHRIYVGTHLNYSGQPCSTNITRLSLPVPRNRQCVGCGVVMLAVLVKELLTADKGDAASVMFAGRRSWL